jgi:hypothetical protein
VIWCGRPCSGWYSGDQSLTRHLDPRTVKEYLDIVGVEEESVLAVSGSSETMALRDLECTS